MRAELVHAGAGGGRPSGRVARQYHPRVLRAVLFDFNGVLVDDEPLHGRLFQRVLAQEGVDLSPADYYARYLGLDDRGCFAAALAAAGREVPPEGLARLIARKAAYYQEAVHRDGVPFFPGVARVVAEARAAGLVLGIVSGALAAEIEGALAQAGLAPEFKVVVAADHVSRGKPDPEGYRAALARLNEEPPLPARLIHPHEVVAIEDSPAGLAAARAAGLGTVAVATSYPAAALGDADSVLATIACLEIGELLGRFS